MKFPRQSLQLLRVVVEDALLTQAALMAPKSPMGVQLELVRLGLLSEADDWRRAEVAERRFARRALQVQLLARLDGLEFKVLVLSTIPVGSESYTRTVPRSELRSLSVPQWDEGGICSAKLQNGGLCTNRREPGEPRCKRHHGVTSRPVVEVTSSGEEAFDWLDDDRAQVRGQRPVRRTVREIALALELSHDQVRRAMSRIHEKLLEAPQLRLLAESA